MTIRVGFLILLAVFTQGRSYDKAVPAKDEQVLTTDNEERIINGQDAVRGQFPYQIGMYMDRKQFCGGAIISKNWILTAGHCVDKIALFTVFLGTLNVNLPKEPGRIVMNTRTAYLHEKYYFERPYDNDIGVVKLPVDIEPNDLIGAIPLPPRSFNERDFIGRAVRVSGWGKTHDNLKWISPTLQFVDLTVISNEKCKETYKYFISDRIVCAEGPNGKSPCNGDSGGALVIKDEKNNKTVHFAVVSFVHIRTGCGSGAPSAYDRTYKFLDWIHEKTGIPIED